MKWRHRSFGFKSEREAEPPVTGPYFLFDCPQYYPGGGVHDLAGVFSTLDEALASRTDEDFTGWHVAVFTGDGAVYARLDDVVSPSMVGYNRVEQPCIRA